MELWIRSQDKEDLIEVHSVEVDIKDKIKIITLINASTIVDLGTYNSKERALEILDEIQNKIKSLIYLKPNTLLQLEDIEARKAYFEKLNHQEFITCDNSFEIVPLSSNYTVIYEMPKE